MAKVERVLKVFTSLGMSAADEHGVRHVQPRLVVATTSQKAAAEAFGMTLNRFRNYGSETTNEHDVAAAMSEPGTVFWTPKDINPPSYRTEGWHR